MSEEKTVKEYFDSVKDEEMRQFFLSVLKSEEFTEDQINEMTIGRAWKLFLDSNSVFFERFMIEFDVLLRQKPHLVRALHPILRRLRKELEEGVRELQEKLDKKERKE